MSQGVKKNAEKNMQHLNSMISDHKGKKAEGSDYANNMQNMGKIKDMGNNIGTNMGDNMDDNMGNSMGNNMGNNMGNTMSNNMGNNMGNKMSQNAGGIEFPAITGGGKKVNSYREQRGKSPELSKDIVEKIKNIQESTDKHKKVPGQQKGVMIMMK
jgi:hypothetical protein